MNKMTMDHVEITGMNSLDELIAALQSVRDQLPEGAIETEVKLRGDDFFGRHILVSYCRPKTELELASDERVARFADEWLGDELRRAA